MLGAGNDAFACCARIQPVEPGKGEDEDARTQDSVGPSHMVGSTYENPMGRASMTPPTPTQLQRASVVRCTPLLLAAPSHVARLLACQRPSACRRCCMQH